MSLAATGLASEVHGDGSHTLVFAHGFTQNRALWRPVVASICRMRSDVRCVLVDLPGHGESASVDADLRTSATLLVESGGRATYVGYSLGARLVLQALVDHPASVLGAVSVSGTAGIEDETERAARRTSDALLAERITRIGVLAFLQEWLEQPLFSDLTHEQAMVSERMKNTAEGLAKSLLSCGQGEQLPLWDDLTSCSRPVLAMAGSRDVKYVAVARRLATTAPMGSLVIVPGTGHSAPLTSHDAVARAIVDWLPRVS